MMISGILNPLLADIDSAASINSRVGVDPISVHLVETQLTVQLSLTNMLVYTHRFANNNNYHYELLRFVIHI